MALSPFKKEGKKRIVILGATGSIGRQTLEVIDQDHAQFDVVGMTAQTRAADLQKLSERYPRAAIFLGGTAEGLIDWMLSQAADLVVVALSGAAGLEPTVAAIRAGRSVALANKETLVMEGSRVMAEARKHGVKLYPIDSEHSALAQLLARFPREEITAVGITCSGGAFRGKSNDELKHVTPQDALKHPTWSMGPKVTIDSATWVNKGFELIEAHHLFDWPLDQIKVKVHPESRVHAWVELKNGAVAYHASPPDMRIAIHAALHALQPEACGAFEHEVEMKIAADGVLPFQWESPENFPQYRGIQVVLRAARLGPDACHALVRADDEAVRDFLSGTIGFLDIYERLESSIRA